MSTYIFTQVLEKDKWVNLPDFRLADDSNLYAIVYEYKQISYEYNQISSDLSKRIFVQGFGTDHDLTLIISPKLSRIEIYQQVCQQTRFVGYVELTGINLFYFLQNLKHYDIEEAFELKTLPMFKTKGFKNK